MFSLIYLQIGFCWEREKGLLGCERFTVLFEKTRYLLVFEQCKCLWRREVALSKTLSTQKILDRHAQCLDKAVAVRANA